MIEDLEFAISQYLDGNLPPDQTAELERQLSANETARNLLAEYRRLDVALRASDPLPPIQWQALAQHISNSIPQQDQPPESYKLPQATSSFWNIRRTAMALAACLFVAIGLAFKFSHHTASDQPAPLAIAIAEIQGPRPEPAAGPALAQVALSPPPAAVAASRQFSYADGLVFEPSHVSIGSAASVPH